MWIHAGAGTSSWEHAVCVSVCVASCVDAADAQAGRGRGRGGAGREDVTNFASHITWQFQFYTFPRRARWADRDTAAAARRASRRPLCHSGARLIRSL